MAIRIGKQTVNIEDIKVSDYDIVNHYFGVTEIPCIIHSPLRKDKNPSFGFYTLDGVKIHWKDYATQESNGIIDLLMLYWGLNYDDTLIRLKKESTNITKTSNSHTLLNKERMTSSKEPSNVKIECRVRPWKPHDRIYWTSYGITYKSLCEARVYPISHKIIISKGKRMIFPADQYAYAFLEQKEGVNTFKIYQPFNKLGYKWSNNHDRSVISLWKLLPETGDKVVICASLKDALCLKDNLNVPTLALQGEGYTISKTVISELSRRFKKVYILFDNDAAGIIDGKKLASQTGFINIVLPRVAGKKDISDLYMHLSNKKEFIELLSAVIK